MNSHKHFLLGRFFLLFFAGILLLSSKGVAFAFVEDAATFDATITVEPMVLINGEWTAQVSAKDPTRIQVNFSRRTEKGGFNQSGDSMKRSELDGLPADLMAAVRTDVNFRLAREAGTLSCEGFFQGGRGAGLWTFTPNASFASSMASRGFANLTEEDMLRAVFNNVTTRYADEIKAAGYDQLTFNQLARAAGHEISVEYIRELRSSGFGELTMDNVIRASNHEISAAYVKEVAAMGFDKQPLDAVIRLKNHEISPAYISELKAAGFENLTLDEVVRMKNHDITSEFVNQIKGEGFSNLSSSTIIRLKNHDVDREFIRRARSQYPNATLDELIRLKNNGTVK